MAIEDVKTLNDALAEARARHPSWSVWVSDAGRYWATRRGKQQITARTPPDWAMTIDADSLADLEPEIERQEALPSLASLPL